MDRRTARVSRNVDRTVDGGVIVAAAAPKLSKRETALLDRLRAGATLCCEIDPAEGSRLFNDGRRWFLEPGGKSVGPKTAAAVIAKHLVIPSVAGLFGATDAQTFEVA